MRHRVRLPAGFRSSQGRVGSERLPARCLRLVLLVANVNAGPLVTFQGADYPCNSIDEFSVALDAFDVEPVFELWLTVPGGPAVSMLRNGASGWLMYLRDEEDAGFRSVGESTRTDQCDFRLSNGQIDQYPAAWCVPIEDCYRALAYFFVNDGLRTDQITWQAL